MPKIIENLEDRLIQEARRQIAESGYGATTIRSVAKGCGVGVGTVYTMIFVGRTIYVINRFFRTKMRHLAGLDAGI